MTDAGAPPLEEVVVADAFAWVGSVGVETDGGRLWCEGDVPYDDLYCGTAGVTGGPTKYSQYASGGFDADVRCS